MKPKVDIMCRSFDDGPYRLDIDGVVLYEGDKAMETFDELVALLKKVVPAESRLELSIVPYDDRNVRGNWLTIYQYGEKQ